MISSSSLPAPSGDASETSRALTARILAEIEARGGFMPFSRYMELALYEPGLGYYVNGGVKFGPAGDFQTAADLGEWLGSAVAAFLAAELERLGTTTLIEVGAGTGRMAATLLTRLGALGRPVNYRIFETSPELRERQRRLLEPYGHQVVWLDRPPEAPLDAVIFANEVADALPVERFTKKAGRVVPLGVAVGADGLSLSWAEGPADENLAHAVARLEANLGRPLADGHTSEICLRLPSWIADLAACLDRGAALVIDYGLVRREYYHAERRHGTLLCHYRHRAHADPFFYPGLQDLSAWVDFSACADAARSAGLEVAGFTTQAQFVLESLVAARIGSPMADLAAVAGPPGALVAAGSRTEPNVGAAASLDAIRALKTLVLPGEMGEKFKLLWLAKGFTAGALPGRDFRSRL